MASLDCTYAHSCYYYSSIILSDRIQPPIGSLLDEADQASKSRIPLGVRLS
jgi:hypothetical protein